MINMTSLIVMTIILIVIIEKKKLSEKRKNFFDRIILELFTCEFPDMVSEIINWLVTYLNSDVGSRPSSVPSEGVTQKSDNNKLTCISRNLKEQQLHSEQNQSPH